ncbi:hypothetical protein [Vibrio spartinae]|nr:hypothetical protein [Vibrio spartinae]
MSPLLVTVDSAFYEPIGYIDSILFAGFFSLLVIFAYRGYEVLFLRNSKPSHKLLSIIFIFGGIVGFTVNHLTYHVVIKKNNFIQCTTEAGYKNNLIDKYVKNGDYCYQ